MKIRPESKGYGARHYHGRDSGRSRASHIRFSSEEPSVQRLTPDDPVYPPQLGAGGPPLYLRGDHRLLDRALIGVFASVKSSGKAILGALAWARAFSEPDSAVVSGFHAPLEQECLTILLTRGVPVIACPAREIRSYRIALSWRTAIDAGKMLLLSRFDSERRMTRSTSDTRNDLVARLSASLVILSVSESGRVEKLARDFEADGMTVRRLLERDRSPK